MMGKNVAAHARYVKEAQLAGQETTDGRFIGGIEHGPTGAAAAGDLMS